MRHVLADEPVETGVLVSATPATELSQPPTLMGLGHLHELSQNRVVACPSIESTMRFMDDLHSVGVSHDVLELGRRRGRNSCWLDDRQIISQRFCFWRL